MRCIAGAGACVADAVCCLRSGAVRTVFRAPLRGAPGFALGTPPLLRGSCIHTTLQIDSASGLGLGRAAPGWAARRCCRRAAGRGAASSSRAVRWSAWAVRRPLLCPALPLGRFIPLHTYPYFTHLSISRPIRDAVFDARGSHLLARRRGRSWVPCQPASRAMQALASELGALGLSRAGGARREHSSPAPAADASPCIGLRLRDTFNWHGPAPRAGAPGSDRQSALPRAALYDRAPSAVA